MPQLIVIPYNHVYISILLIVTVGLLSFYKTLTPLISREIKYNIKLKLKLIELNLIWIYSITCYYNLQDSYFYIVNQFIYNLHLNFFRITKFILGEQQNSSYLVDILIDKTCGNKLKIL